MAMRRYLLLSHLLSAALLSAAAPMASSQAKGDDDVVFVSEKDPEMVAAIRQARASLPEFLKQAAHPPTGTEGYKLKVMITDGPRVEHFWVIPFKQEADGFSGTLANDPQVVRNVKGGQSIRFTSATVTDWGYTRNGRQVGSYTVCVLLKKMPAQQAEHYRKNYGFDC
ncbi:MAG: hypothetical protein GAK35_01370 [Herbaspirillum frisingense]|uniref:DUF2314 domain-containing protein n=1 Tax=Herbaspirillum frisingense TaxID=92645 RepID=A0A7V8JVA0_9BURK|nr:MAG: hypothetical protein GAK35_01370 [Herbaspirillum frisingense]